MNKSYFESVESYYKTEFRDEYPAIRDVKRFRRKAIDVWPMIDKTKIR